MLIIFTPTRRQPLLPRGTRNLMPGRVTGAMPGKRKKIGCPSGTSLG
jgi:hypothetical protein